MDAILHTDYRRQAAPDNLEKGIKVDEQRQRMKEKIYNLYRIEMEAKPKKDYDWTPKRRNVVPDTYTVGRKPLVEREQEAMEGKYADHYLAALEARASNTVMRKDTKTGPKTMGKIVEEFSRQT